MLMLGQQHCHFKDKWVGWHGDTSLALHWRCQVVTFNKQELMLAHFIIGHQINFWLNVWVDMLQSRGHHYFDRAVTNMDYCPFDLLVHKNQAIE